MSHRRELAELLADVLADNCPPKVVEESEGAMSTELWTVLDGLGLTALGISEDEGGSGGDLHDVVTVLQVAARFAAPIPIMESLLLAPALRRRFGASHQPGPAAVALDAVAEATQVPTGWRITGTLSECAYGHVAADVLVLASDLTGGRAVLAQLPAMDVTWSSAPDLAGIPRDSVELDVVVPSVHTVVQDELRSILEELRNLRALGLSWSMVGAMEKVQALTVTYTTEREQFGRTLSRFQAVKQLAAEIAGGVSVARAGALEATKDVVSGRDASFPIAACRARSAMAATEVSRLAHQLHGAIGYTREYPLHHYTRRLWVWRDEGGTAAEWLEAAGERVLAHGADQFWQTLTGR